MGNQLNRLEKWLAGPPTAHELRLEMHAAKHRYTFLVRKYEKANKPKVVQFYRQKLRALDKYELLIDETGTRMTDLALKEMFYEFLNQANVEIKELNFDPMEHELILNEYQTRKDMDGDDDLLEEDEEEEGLGGGGGGEALRLVNALPIAPSGPVGEHRKREEVIFTSL